MRALRWGAVVLAASTVGRQAQAQAPTPAQPQTQESPKAAPAPEYSIEGHFLRITQIGASTTVDIGCVGRSALRAGEKLFVACGAAGVVEFDLTDPAVPRRDGEMLVDGTATDLFLHDGLPWVEVAHVDARPVRVGSMDQTPARTMPIVVPTRDLAPAVVGGTPKKEPESIVAPARHGGIWELSLISGAFLGFGNLGFGVLGSASVAYRFESPFVLRAEVAPFGVAGPSTTTNCCSSPLGQTSTSGGAVGVFAANVFFGLDTQLVEVGLGIGGASVNSSSSTGASPQTGSVSIVESARIGARDGLALNVETSAIAVNHQFSLGYFTTSVQIPLSAKAMLVARGGGGDVGFGYGDLGVRVLVRGDGGKGTVALTGFAGVDLIQENLCTSNPLPPFTTACNTATLLGPALGGGVEWRL